ncbi:protein O-glucosyltransferase 2-like [Antedon mediterranea]|uniref:protein O-glucosyltransferase 2-like n=1 Tax=Antedon mediterranea TaxID=105859 RepID=UPI003AF8D999
MMQRIPSLQMFIQTVFASVMFFSLVTLTESVKDKQKRVVCPKQTIVWGPGLKADFTVPARYFFIQAVDLNGQNFTDSPGENTYTVKVGPKDRRGRIWLQVLDRHDGSFLVRYRMFESYQNMQVDVKIGEKHVAKSPYTLKGPVYDEKCYCPNGHVDDWLDSMQCRQDLHPQIEKDLLNFPSVNLDNLAEKVIAKYSAHHSLSHYTIINNKIYRKTHGLHTGFKMFSDAFLLSLTRKVRLPDMEFFINLGDWPLVKKTNKKNVLPIFSWCGSNETYDIVLPTYDVTESTLETMGRVSLDLLSVQANTQPKWEEKVGKGFWRGRDSRKERLELVKLARNHTDLIDAGLTNFFFFEYKEELYGPKHKHVSFFDFFKYKYQVNIDGTVAAYRLPYLLCGNSVVLKHDSIYYEHFYDELQPWVHYIPFNQNLSDLLDKIKWAQEHDEEAEQIGQNAQAYVKKNLLSNQIYCYYYQALTEYSKRFKSNPRIHEGMEEVLQPDESKCQCDRKMSNRDEL